MDAEFCVEFVNIDKHSGYFDFDWRTMSVKATTITDPAWTPLDFANETQLDMVARNVSDIFPGQAKANAFMWCLDIQKAKDKLAMSNAMVF